MRLASSPECPLAPMIPTGSVCIIMHSYAIEASFASRNWKEYLNGMRTHLLAWLVLASCSSRLAIANPDSGGTGTPQRSQAGSDAQPANAPPLRDQLRHTVVFLGRGVGETFVGLGTGFLINSEGINCLVTAKHVAFAAPDLAAYVGRKDGSIERRLLADVKTKWSVEWVAHPAGDVAIIPFPIDDKGDDVRVIQDSLFLPFEEVAELYDVFFVSYQPGLPAEHTLWPVFRSGMVSKKNPDATLLIDGLAFPGRSDSPVFRKPPACRLNGQQGYTFGPNLLDGRFVGIVGAYLPYQETAVSPQTGRARIIFEENSGLALVWSVRYLLETLRSPSFRAMVARLRQP